MNSVGAIKPMDQEETQTQAIISEMLTRALRETVYPVDFSMYSTCPRAEVEPIDLPVIYPMPYETVAVSVRTLRRRFPPQYTYVYISSYMYTLFIHICNVNIIS